MLASMTSRDAFRDQITTYHATFWRLNTAVFGDRTPPGCCDELEIHELACVAQELTLQHSLVDQRRDHARALALDPLTQPTG